MKSSDKAIYRSLAWHSFCLEQKNKVDGSRASFSAFAQMKLVEIVEIVSIRLINVTIERTITKRICIR